MNNTPHRINPIENNERRTSRNCLRVDYIADGTISPRCNLRPNHPRAEWILENRPFHIQQAITMFDYCVGNDCATCWVFQETEEKATPFLSLSIRVRKIRGKMAVLALGNCAWYDLYTGNDINDVAAWVKAHGGVLGGYADDGVYGRCRVGFVNAHKINTDLLPDWYARQINRN